MIQEKRKYIPKVSVEELLFMHDVWTNSFYNPADIAFKIRAVSLARIECRLHQLETGDSI